MAKLNRDMIDQHVELANELRDNLASIPEIILYLSGCAMKANPGRATPDYIASVMSHENYTGNRDGMNNTTNIRNVLNKLEIPCSKEEMEIKFPKQKKKKRKDTRAIASSYSPISVTSSLSKVRLV